MENLRVEYERELSRTRRRLENVSSMDINIDNLNNELMNIIKPETVNSNGFQALKELNYSSALKSLINFQKRLEYYDILFKIKNSVIYLNEFITKEMNEKNVIKARDEILISLEQLKICDYSLISEFGNTATILFDTVYNIIKLECIYLGKSKVLDFIVKEEIYIKEINNRIIEDVEKLKTAINNIDGLNNLKAVMFERSKMGTLTHYVCNEVFSALVVCTSSDIVKENIKEKLNNYLKSISEVNNELSDKIEVKNDLVNSAKSFREDAASYLEYIKMRLIVLFLSGSIIGGLAYASHFPAKSSSTYHKYMTTTSTITLEEGKVDGEPEYQTKVNEGYKVELVSNKYSPGFLFFSDSIETLTYDVTEEFPQGKEYTFDDFSFLEKKSVTNSETTETLDDITEEEIEAIKEVYKFIVTTQDLEDENVVFEKGEYNMLLFLIVAVALVIFGAVLYLFSFEEFPSDLVEFIKYKRREASSKKDLNKLLLESFNTLQYNDRLKEEFIEFYKNNELVIDEHFKSLYDKIKNSLDSNEELKLRFKEK